MHNILLSFLPSGQKLTLKIDIKGHNRGTGGSLYFCYKIVSPLVNTRGPGARLLNQ